MLIVLCLGTTSDKPASHQIACIFGYLSTMYGHVIVTKASIQMVKGANGSENTSRAEVLLHAFVLASEEII